MQGIHIMREIQWNMYKSGFDEADVFTVTDNRPLTNAELHIVECNYGINAVNAMNTSMSYAETFSKGLVHPWARQPLSDTEWNRTVHPNGDSFTLFFEFDSPADPFHLVSLGILRPLHPQTGFPDYSHPQLNALEFKGNIWFPPNATVHTVLRTLGRLPYRYGYFGGLHLVGNKAQLLWFS